MKSLPSLLFLLLVVFICNFPRTSAKNPPIKPPCLKLIDSVGLFNPNLLTMDTCQNSNTYNMKFGYHGYVRFKVKATNIPYHHDTTHLDTNWSVIDTAFSIARSLFQSIETEFGQFTLTKFNPADTSNISRSQLFILVFDSYVPIQRVDSMLSSLPNFMDAFLSSNMYYITPVEEPVFEQINAPTVIFNEQNSEIIISSSNLKVENAILYDMRGDIVSQSQVEGGKAQIGVSAISAGTYFVKYGTFTKKITIGGKR
jgi:hypothetical protein